ncbi:hypothetical protein [Myroides sp. LJL119]
MSKLQTKYDCFDQKGETNLPDNQFIESLIKNDIEPIIYIDSCVCLHIIKVIDHKKKAKNINFERIISLKEYLIKHPSIQINPFFALLELCYLKTGYDSKKMFELKLRIDFFIQLPLKSLKSFQYDFHRDIVIKKDLSKEKFNSLEAVDQIIKNTYCTLLKIRSIALKKLTKQKAENNINELSDWMINELNIFRGAEYKLALNIFGGNTEYRKMIGLDSKNSEDIKKKILGSSWDMYHSKLCANNLRISQILQKNIHPFFLTSDANLFKLFHNVSIEIIKDGGDESISSYIMMSDFTYPHFEESFIEKNNQKLLNLWLQRSNYDYSYNDNMVNKLIWNLEIENGIIL